jgi:hypothetical protein
MAKFLADTTTIKFLVIFLISELMFFGPKKNSARVRRFVSPDISGSHPQRVNAMQFWGEV